MRFWDSSAIVPLLVDEAASERVRQLYALDPEMVVWWSTEVECASALARRAREQGTAVGEALEPAQAQLDRFAQRWHEVAPTQGLRRIARRILKTHGLRAADALQLAAALAARGEQAAALEFVCEDVRLAAAARLEGLTIAATDLAREPEESSYQIARRLGVIGSDTFRRRNPAARAKQEARRAIRARRRRRK